MEKKFGRPVCMTDAVTHYCPGCGHGIAHRLVAEVLDEMKMAGKTVAVAPVGCAVLAYNYWNLDTSEAAHGRTPAVATGIKRVLPDRLVFTYQGDGDLAAIGTAESVHAANRGEHITIIFVNNGVYGMTGGQMAPTTLLNQKTSTTPLGRNPSSDGYPAKISEMLAVLPGTAYIERASLHKPGHVIKAKKAIKKAFMLQMQKKGFTMVELVSPCPTYWRMDPKDTGRWIEEKILKYYPLGVLAER